jgi:hypothetical protein
MTALGVLKTRPWKNVIQHYPFTMKDMLPLDVTRSEETPLGLGPWVTSSVRSKFDSISGRDSV